MKDGHFIDLHSHPLALAGALVLQEAEEGGVHFISKNYDEANREFLELQPEDMVVSEGIKPHGVTKVAGNTPRIAIIWGVEAATRFV